MTVDGFAPGVPNWIDLVTTDPQGARAFYGALLGWEFDIGTAEAGFYTYCTRNGQRAAGMVGVAVDTMPTAWTTYMATEDVAATGRRMTDAGGSLLLGPVEAGPAGSVVVCTDPAGAVIGAWQPGEHAGFGILDEPGAVVWSELATPDLAAAVSFYTAVFGYQWESDESGYATFSVDGRTAGGAAQVPGAPATWTPYLGVSDVDDAVAQTRRLGGAVQVGAADSPYGRWARLTDPQGGLFNVLAIPDAA
jgi:predicted enzyme related to lactoylglutathione lyase